MKIWTQLVHTPAKAAAANSLLPICPRKHVEIVIKEIRQKVDRLTFQAMLQIAETSRCKERDEYKAELFSLGTYPVL
jgi:hypothetical protein